MADQSNYAIRFGMDGRFSLLVMGFCNLICASLSSDVLTAAANAGMLQVQNFLLCCVAKCQQIASYVRAWQHLAHGRGLSFCTS